MIQRSISNYNSDFANVLRAARKFRMLTQKELVDLIDERCNKLGLNDQRLSQPFLSNIERGLTLPNVRQWAIISNILEIKPDSGFKGYIDNFNNVNSSEIFLNWNKKFKSNNNKIDSTVRSLGPLINYFKNVFGEKKFADYLNSKHIDVDYLCILSNPIPSELPIDLFSQISSAGKVGDKYDEILANCLSRVEHHGDLHAEFIKKDNYIDRFEVFVDFISHYEKNCDYQLLNITSNSFDLSISPTESYLEILRDSKYNKIGESLCYYKKQYVLNSPGLPAKQGSRFLHEPECFFKGGHRCIYQVVDLSI